MLPDLHQALSSSRLNERVRLERVANNPAPFLPRSLPQTAPRATGGVERSSLPASALAALAKKSIEFSQ